MPWQLLVVDGADREQVFPLPGKGVVVVGGSKKHADICLHDLFVQRTHCEIEVSDADAVEVRNLRPVEGIYVNKTRVETQELNAGDVLRVGNTHLRLEVAVAAGAAPTPRAAPEAPAKTKPAAPTPVPTVPPERLPELSGHLLGHYLLGELLGSTPHKAVFAAVDQKTDEQVVVKVLSPRFPARPEELQRFGDLMRKAAQLKHEHLISPRGVGKVGPYVWLAREHVPGDSLAGILEKLVGGHKKVKWQSGVRLALQLGGVLDFLHRQHVMHGHLTPDSIIVNTEAKQVKLANLLLDHALAGSAVGKERRAENRLRNAAWLSPEQCEPGAYIDDMSDQYTLGALVFARMTGRPPFVGDTPEETMDLIRTAPLLRPREINTHIPPVVEAIVVRMLSRHQEDRFPNPAALLSDLERLGVNS